MLVGATLAVGCGVSLRDRPVRSIEADTLHVRSICPGGRVPLRVVATLADGERLATQGPGEGDVRWDDYDVSLRGASFDDGYLEVSEDARDTWETQAALVRIRSRFHDVGPARARVPVRYACSFVARFEGDTGRTGSRGMDGRDGMNGSIATRGPGTGHRGGDGGDGTRGGDGGDGGPGPYVWVGVTRVRTGAYERPLIAVTVRAGARSERVYVVNPRGGSLEIGATGGRGGDGGAGGRGGDGGRGDPDGRSGAGGHGGRGGDGGRGGRIDVEVAEDARELLSALRFDVSGGAAGGSGVGGGCGSPCGFTGASGSRGRRGPDGPPPRVRVVSGTPRGAVVLTLPSREAARAAPDRSVPTTSGGERGPGTALGDPR